jgi:hypothetical protein
MCGCLSVRVQVGGWVRGRSYPRRGHLGCGQARQRGARRDPPDQTAAAAPPRSPYTPRNSPPAPGRRSVSDRRPARRGSPACTRTHTHTHTHQLGKGDTLTAIAAILTLPRSLRECGPPVVSHTTHTMADADAQQRAELEARVAALGERVKALKTSKARAAAHGHPHQPAHTRHMHACVPPLPTLSLHLPATDTAPCLDYHSRVHTHTHTRVPVLRGVSGWGPGRRRGRRRRLPE